MNSQNNILKYLQKYSSNNCFSIHEMWIIHLLSSRELRAQRRGGQWGWGGGQRNMIWVQSESLHCHNNINMDGSRHKISLLTKIFPMAALWTLLLSTYLRKAGCSIALSPILRWPDQLSNISLEPALDTIEINYQKYFLNDLKNLIGI